MTHNQYNSEPPGPSGCTPGEAWRQAADVLATSHGWYDVTVTADIDASWSQRFIGHIETGDHSITGSF